MSSVTPLLHQLEALYALLPCCPFAISQKEREERQLVDCCWTYGEALFSSVFTLLGLAKLEAGEQFVDCGCGTGKVVHAAALYQPKAQCHGIEGLLHVLDCAKEVSKQLDGCMAPQWHYGAIEHHDYRPYNLIYCAGTCFTDAMLVKLVQQWKLCAVGTRFLIVGQQIQHQSFLLRARRTVPMGWNLSGVTASLYHLVDARK